MNMHVAQTRAHIDMHVYICINTCMHVPMSYPHAYAYKYTNAFAWTYTNTYVYIDCAYVCICTSALVYAHICAHVSMLLCASYILISYDI